MNNVEFFIARRLSYETLDGKNRVMIRTATLSIAISVAVMIIALSVIVGFKDAISSKVIGFNSHITINNLDNNHSYTTTPISSDQPFIDSLKSLPQIKSINKYAIKSGVIDNNGTMDGVVLKGVSRDYDMSFLKSNLVEGEFFDANDSVKSKSIIISSLLAKELGLKVGSKSRMMFVEDPPRRDVFTVTGIYDTSLAEFDKIMVYTDIRNVVRLNGWNDNQITGYEIMINDISKISKVVEEVEDIIFAEENIHDEMLMTQDVTQTNKAIFDWLALQDINVVIISVIMLFVAGFNMISMMLILLLDKRAMIGILKTMGMGNHALQKMFLFRASYITIRGIALGVVVGVALCYIQKYTGIVKLSQSAYFMSEVPVNINLVHVLLIVLGSIIATFVIQIIPTFIISKISPDKSVNYQ